MPLFFDAKTKIGCQAEAYQLVSMVAVKNAPSQVRIQHFAVEHRLKTVPAPFWSDGDVSKTKRFLRVYMRTWDSKVQAIRPLRDARKTSG